MLPVVFAINNTYVKQLATVITSIIKNTKQTPDYSFNILSSDISSENIDILSKYIKKISHNQSEINFIDMKASLKQFDLEAFMSRRDNYKYISIETYFRFFIPELFPKQNKILYLDADILVLDDLHSLFNENIDDYYAGVIQDTFMEVFVDNDDIKTNTTPQRTYKDYFKNKLHKKNTHYFNAGVLLMNLAKIREDNVIQKLWNFAIKESPLEYQDQDVLNAVLESNIKYVDYKWNTLKDLNILIPQIKDSDKRQHLLKTYSYPGIFHYVGANKPWVLHDNYNYNFIGKWWKYYRSTPYFKREELSILKHAKWLRDTKKSKYYITFRILNFILMDIFEKNKTFHLQLLQFIKFNKRLKEPKAYKKLTSI